jgi:hypothetical protein
MASGTVTRSLLVTRDMSSLFWDVMTTTFERKQGALEGATRLRVRT